MIQDDLLWVVEILFDGVWCPTVGVSICRADARRKLKDWKKNNYVNKFRLRKYRRHP
jgi:hypothetical protein